MRTFLLPSFTFFFLIIFFATACQQKPTERDKLYNEVMEIHDDVMPETSIIHRLKKQLKAIDTTTVKQPNYPTILKHLTALDKADEAMYAWMAEFSNPTPETDEVSALKYLEKEKLSISTVRDQMRQSIAAAKSILSEIKTNSPADAIPKK